ncbi:hypothetical protein PENTCL1PPCAC_8357, partial [Pristionchus entomophagus]
GSESDHSRISEQFSDLANSSDVLQSVLDGESEVLAKSMSNVVAVQSVAGNAHLSECLFKSEGNGGLSRSGQSGEPDRAASESLMSAQHVCSLHSAHGVFLQSHVCSALNLLGISIGTSLSLAIAAHCWKEKLSVMSEGVM